jgi:hypothetical protein
MTMGAGIRNMVISAWLLWLFTFVVSRINNFHEAYIEESNKRSNEKWILKQCSDPEFFSNMKQHADALCSKVENNARASLLLRALNRVASSTYVCGSSSCIDTAYSFVVRFGWQASLLVAVLMMVAPNLVFAILRHIQQQRHWQQREDSLMLECMPVYSSSTKHGMMEDQSHAIMSIRQNESMLRMRNHNTIQMI